MTITLKKFIEREQKLNEISMENVKKASEEFDAAMKRILSML